MAEIDEPSQVFFFALLSKIKYKMVPISRNKQQQQEKVERPPPLSTER
jgi:hypothetical protein